MSDHLPFTYMRKPEVLKAVGFRHSKFQTEIREGRVPPPDKHGAQSLWRSDLVAQWLVEQSAKAEAERAERTKAARSKAESMVRARREQKRAA